MGKKTSKKMPGMVSMAKQSEAHHTAPMPGARHHYEAFPRFVVRALWLSAAIGGLVGFVWGRVIQAHAFPIPGWEQLFSMEQLAFPTFWTIAGIALGVAIGGVGALLLAEEPQV